MAETELPQNRRAWLGSDGRMVSEITAGWQVDAAKLTYSAATGSFVPAATPTDMAVLTNSGTTKLIRVIKVRITGTATTATTFEFAILKRTTLDTGGTSTVVRAVRMDSTDAVATASVLLYSANPATLGTLADTTGLIEDQFITLSGGAALGNILDLDLPVTGKSIILRANESLCLNGLGAAIPPGAKFNARLSWTEETLAVGQPG